MSEVQVLVNNFSYSEGALSELEHSLSRERMNTYVFATPNHDMEAAIRLYVWNTAISSAFYGVLQGLEVAVRNAMHRELSRQYGASWFDNPCVGIDDGGMRRIQSAKQELHRRRYEHTLPASVVASLSFGFWVSLLGPGGLQSEQNRRANYEMTMWRPALRQAFPHTRSLTRRQAHAALERLRILRNRIAHHEPIFRRRLDADHELILDVTSWISPNTSEWLSHHSRVPMLLEGGPSAGNNQF